MVEWKEDGFYNMIKIALNSVAFGKTDESVSVKPQVRGRYLGISSHY